MCFLQVCHHSIILIQHILKESVDDGQDEIMSDIVASAAQGNRAVVENVVEGLPLSTQLADGIANVPDWHCVAGCPGRHSGANFRRAEGSDWTALD